MLNEKQENIDQTLKLHKSKFDMNDKLFEEINKLRINDMAQ
jgi:hypothetical protein